MAARLRWPAGLKPTSIKVRQGIYRVFARASSFVGSFVERSLDVWVGFA
jgi:hypothetical protein